MKKLIAIILSLIAAIGATAQVPAGAVQLYVKNAGTGATPQWTTVATPPAVFGVDVGGVMKQFALGAGLSIVDSTLVATATGGTWGTITGTLSAQTDLQTALNAKLSTATAATTYQPLATVLTNTTASFTSALETKLNGIAAGAEVNVNADWNAASGDAQILNKPTLGTMAAETASDYSTTATIAAAYQPLLDPLVSIGNNGAGGGRLGLWDAASDDFKYVWVHDNQIDLTGLDLALANISASGIIGTLFGDINLPSINPSFRLEMRSNETLTASRRLNLIVGDTARTLTLTGDATVSGTNTGTQTITLTGDVTGSGTGSFAATLANTAVTPGVYASPMRIIVDSKGRVTFASTSGPSGTDSVDGDFTGFGGAGGHIQASGGSGYADGGLEQGYNGGDSGVLDMSGGNADSGGAGLHGGSIYTHSGGGSIYTTGTGTIGLGNLGTRTTVTGTATEDRDIAFPDASGTVALTSDISPGASPAGSGSELQYRVDGSTFGAVTGSSVSGGALALSQGTITDSMPALSLAATWNDAADVMRGLEIDITDTASASASTLVRAAVGGALKAAFSKTGHLQLSSDDGVLIRVGGTNALTFFNGTAAVTANVLDSLNWVSFRESGLICQNFAGSRYFSILPQSSTPGNDGIQLGSNHASTATAQTIKAHDVTTGRGANLQLSGGSGSSSQFGYIILQNLPTSASGLPTGALWNDSGTVKVAP